MMTEGLTETPALGGVAAIQANRAARREMRAGLRERLREERARLRRAAPDQAVGRPLAAAPDPDAPPACEEPAPETRVAPPEPASHDAPSGPAVEIGATVFGQLMTDAPPHEVSESPPEPLTDARQEGTPCDPPALEAPEPDALPPLAMAPDEAPTPAPPEAVRAVQAVAPEAAQGTPAQALPLPGMGPGMVLRLRHLGIESTAQMAEADPAALRRALGPISRLVNVEGWIAAARETG